VVAPRPWTTADIIVSVTGDSFLKSANKAKPGLDWSIFLCPSSGQLRTWLPSTDWHLYLVISSCLDSLMLLWSVFCMGTSFTWRYARTSPCMLPVSIIWLALTCFGSRAQIALGFHCLTNLPRSVVSMQRHIAKKRKENYTCSKMLPHQSRKRRHIRP